jgi:N-acetylmuramoyl-L-alanine amidase
MAWDTLGAMGRLSRGRRTITFIVGVPEFMGSEGQRNQVPAPYWKGDALYFPAAFIQAAAAYFSAPPPAGSYGIAAIVIDPGHGGKDSGAVANHGSGKTALTILEKDVNLAVGLRIFERLKLTYPSKKILITRSRDVYLSLQERVDIANSVPIAKDEAVIYVSIHVNSAPSKSARGFEVWYLDPSIRRKVLSEAQQRGVSPELIPIFNQMMEEEITTESILLASNILKALDEAIGTLTVKRGIKDASWFVVKNALMPSALVELPFASNEADARILADSGHLQRMADAIYNGIAAFVSYFESSKGFTQ